MWHWIEDGERSTQVQPLRDGKIWTLNENDDDNDDEQSAQMCCCKIKDHKTENE